MREIVSPLDGIRSPFGRRGGSAPPPAGDLVTSVTQGSTTFTFSKEVRAGQYWNGDWWVIADPTATITSVTPNSVDSAGRIIHGLMKDPYRGAGSTGSQGFDSAPINGTTPRGTITYSAGLNIDPTITATAVPVTEGSYVKAESLTTISGETRIKRYTVLTVVPSAPPANAFRPGIRAASKVLNKTTANINWGLRRNISGFTPVADLTSGISSLKAAQWTWAAMNEAQRGYYPSDGLNVYGANWGDALAERMLAFHGQYSQAQLEETVHSIVQIGIDLIAAADDGMEWSVQEGHHIFRKFPALMAALLLDDAAMKATVNYSLAAKAFGGDDDAHYYITQAMIDNSPFPNDKPGLLYAYTQEHLGMPEWGSAANSATFSGSTDGIAVPDLRANYRVLTGLRHFLGTAWVHATSGAEALCNPAMLDYHDRIAEILAGQFTSGLYSTTGEPLSGNPTTNWGSTPFTSTRFSQYNTLRAFSARPVFVNVPEEMNAPALTANVGGTVGVAANATNAFLSPRASVSAISSYQLRWRPITNLTGTTTPDASIPWQVITGITSLPYTLSGVPGNTQIRVQLRAVNAQGTGVWLDPSPDWIEGTTNTRYATTVTTHNTASAPQNVKAPVIQLAVLGQNEVARCDPGIWVGNPAPTIAYQWKRNGSNISGATSQTYTTGAADIGTTLTCDVAATNASGTTTLATGGRSIVSTPTLTFAPTISTSLFDPIWHYAAKVLSGSGFVYGQASASLLANEDGALRLKDVSGASFDNVADAEVLMEFELSAVNSARAQIILRGAGDNNEQGYILGYTRDSSAGSTDLIIDRLDSGVRTPLANFGIGGSGIPANTRYSLRVQAQGTTLRARYWLTSGSEPGTWDVTITDATYASGFIGAIIPQQTNTRIYRFDVIVTAASVPSEITPIETLTASSWDGGANVERTLTFTETLQTGDLIIVTRARDAADTITGLSGYTVRQNNLNLNSNQGVIRTEYLIAGGTPPTSVVVPVEGAGAPVTIRVQVFRGVNASPFSVSDTTANTNGPSLAAAAITPAHDDCYIYCVANYNDRDATLSSYWANLTAIRSAVNTGNGSTSTSNTNIQAGVLLSGGNGTPFSPGTLTMAGGASEGMTTITMALRPA
jgi:hypothetical protein